MYSITYYYVLPVLIMEKNHTFLLASVYNNILIHLYDPKSW